MNNVKVGQKVELQVFGQTVKGVVDKEPMLTPGGYVAGVTLLPEFAHLLPTGSTDALVDELTPVK